MVNFLKQRIIDSHDYHIYSCLWIHEKQLLKVEQSSMLPCVYSCDILYSVNWEGGKENFYSHKSITLREKKMWCILSIFIWQHRKRQKKWCFDLIKEIYFLICNTTYTLREYDFFSHHREYLKHENHQSIPAVPWEATLNKRKYHFPFLLFSAMSVHTKGLFQPRQLMVNENRRRWFRERGEPIKLSVAWWFH